MTNGADWNAMTQEERVTTERKAAAGSSELMLDGAIGRCSSTI